MSILTTLLNLVTSMGDSDELVVNAGGVSSRIARSNSGLAKSGANADIASLGKTGGVNALVALNTGKGADVASASSCNIWGGEDGNFLNVTGTTDVNDFGTAPQAGAWRIMRAAGAFKLKNGAPIAVPGAADYTCTVGDVFLVVALTTTTFVIAAYARINGQAIVGGAGASLEVTDGSVDVLNVSKISVPSGSLTDNGSGHVTLAFGSGSGGSLEETIFQGDFTAQASVDLPTVFSSTYDIFRVYIQRLTVDAAGEVRLGYHLQADLPTVFSGFTNVESYAKSSNVGDGAAYDTYGGYMKMSVGPSLALLDVAAGKVFEAFLEWRNPMAAADTVVEGWSEWYGQITGSARNITQDLSAFIQFPDAIDGFQILPANGATTVTCRVTVTGIKSSFAGGGGSGGSGGGSALPFGCINPPPLLADMTWVNQGSATGLQANAGQPISMRIPSEAPVNVRGLKKAIPGTPFSEVVYLAATGKYVSSQIRGLYFTDGTKFLGLELVNSAGSLWVRVQQWADINTAGSTVYNSGAVLWPGMSAPICFAIGHDGTNLKFYTSNDGWQFDEVYSQAAGTYLTPTAWMFGGLNNTGGVGDAEWLLSLMSHLELAVCPPVSPAVPAGGGAGAEHPIATTSYSGAMLAESPVFDDTYDIIRAYVKGLTVASDGEAGGIVLREQGVGYDTSNYKGPKPSWKTGAAAAVGNPSARFDLNGEYAGGIGSAAGKSYEAFFEVRNMRSASLYKILHGWARYTDDAGNYIEVDLGGVLANVGKMDRIKLFTDTGNLACSITWTGIKSNFG